MKLQETYVDTWETRKRKNRINTADMAAAGYTYTLFKLRLTQQEYNNRARACGVDIAPPVNAIKFQAN